MLVFFIKQLINVRKAIVGRNEPAQLAWGVAFGVLLGIVPHGNLLAVVLLLILLSLHVNHGIATVAAVASTFLATRLDPYSHQVGRYVLTHQDFSRHLSTAWEYPFVPWTDINNTIVAGSFLIGVAALLPIFLITYPIFHFFAPKGTPIDGGTGTDVAMAATAAATPKPVAQDTRRHAAHTDSMPPAPMAPSTVGEPAILGTPLTFGEQSADSSATASGSLEPSAIDAAMSGLVQRTDAVVEEPHLMETRIDVIRIAKRQPTANNAEVAASDVSEQDEPMSEALNYLLRQLRDTRERRAA